RKQKNAEVLMAEVVGVDARKQIVKTRDGEIPYDYLILATGINYNYFGHDDWKEIAPGLDSADDADRIRGKILRAFETAELLAAEGHADPERLRSLLTFVLVGGGTAGVEMAGTIAEMARLALRGDFRHIDPRSAHILLFEAAPRILPTYPEILSQKASRHLQKIGVDVRINAMVEDVDPCGVVVNRELTRSQTVLWTAGVVASPAGRWLGAETDRTGRVIVNSDLSVPGYENVFAIGDTALVVAYLRNLFGIRSKKPEPLPGVAQPAIQEGKYVASVIRRRVLHKSAPAPFCYWDKGNLAIIGRTYAVADMKLFRFAGVFAWLLWLGVHIYFLIGFANRMLVMIQWGVSFWTKRRGVRIFPLAREGDGGSQ
ncbi:MAG TPA: NAD(P)/FAD-dependent oxidoreductase, partial [Blastocatellia bacterium]|nr:NAD(P)/FAD-dependent oxidoreductase [Blastocatellia bacterium]